MNLDRVTEIAAFEMKKWGLTAKGWTFKFSQALTLHGQCLYDTKEIVVSAFLANTETEEQVTDTIRHEIAHALVGHKVVSHGVVWQRKAREVGATPIATATNNEATELALKAKIKYVMLYDGKIVQEYLRKPNKKTLVNIKGYWVNGRKKETLGKLYVAVYNPRIHLEKVPV
jgi:predicted SprT family Zn-dependent metalloprotease